MEQSNLSLALEDDSGQTSTPSCMDEKGKVFTFSAEGSETNLASLVTNQVVKVEVASDEKILEDGDIYGHDKENTNLSLKKGLAIPSEEMVVENKIEEVQKIELSKSNDERGDVFERLIFSKARIVKKDATIPGFKSTTSMKKSFWIYPITQKQFTQNEKEEADLLTTFGLNPLVPKSTQSTIDNSLPFITEYFANYNVSSTSLFSFVLNRNEKQESYQNQYNPAGVRYFFGCLANDFELVKYIDQQKQVRFRLEPCQCLFLIETKFPFASFFNNVLGHLFNIVRVKRLELFSQHYNGNERDPSNLESIRFYDATTVLSVGTINPDSEHRGSQTTRCALRNNSREWPRRYGPCFQGETPVRS